jgi:GNAT superfamily N-acetyltransferase
MSNNDFFCRCPVTGFAGKPLDSICRQTYACPVAGIRLPVQQNDMRGAVTADCHQVKDHAGNDTVVSRAIQADAGIIAGFNMAMAFETEGRELDPATALDGVEGLLCRPEFGFYLLARCDGAPAGSLLVTYEWSDWRAGVIWWLQSVYVEPAFRRRGIFRSLYRHVCALAGADSLVRGIRLYVEHENMRAKAAYVREGMQPAHYEIYEFFPEGC